MSTSTSFQRPERAPYELGFLLRTLPRHLSVAELTAEKIDQVDAASQHADIVVGTLLDGLESMGRLMWSASCNEENPVDAEDLGNLGQLVSSLAVQLQFLNDFRSDANEYMRRVAQQGAAK